MSSAAFAPPPRGAEAAGGLAAVAAEGAAAALALTSAARSAAGSRVVSAGAPPAGPAGMELAMKRSRQLAAQLPPMEGSVVYKRGWTIDEALEQHQCLMRQHELQTSIGENHAAVRRAQAEFAQLSAMESAAELRRALAGMTSLSDEELLVVAKRAAGAAAELRAAVRLCALEEERASQKAAKMEEEIKKSNREMVQLREAIDDVRNGGGYRLPGSPSSAALPINPPVTTTSVEDRKFFYCSDCRVGGHGQRFCNYFLQRPNWRVYPSEKWFEDKSGQVSYCPIGKAGVDFTDETYFARIAMHIKGRIWLEDKLKLYEFVPDYMPLTFVIEDQRWVGAVPDSEPADAPPMPWFVKETDRNWGTSVVCCARPQDCLGLAKPGAVYVVQKHIPKPLLYTNGEKCHIKFYNLLIGMADGVTWNLYTYKDGYLSISPKAWDPTDLSKEGQVTIIRTKRINDWPYWPKVYPTCKNVVATVVKRAAEQGKLEGRNKKQFEILSADFIVSEDLSVYLLEFNLGPVLKDAEDSPDVHDAGMVAGALHIVEPWEQGTEDQWDLALECKGLPPKPGEY